MTEHPRRHGDRPCLATEKRETTMYQFLKSSCLALALCVAPALPASLNNPAYPSAKVG